MRQIKKNYKMASQYRMTEETLNRYSTAKSQFTQTSAGAIF